MNDKFLELDDQRQKQLIYIAEKCLGIPYRLGAEVTNLACSPEEIKEIDCSELTQYCYYQIGYNLVDGSYNQFNVSVDIVDIDNIAKIGDLFFRRNFKTKLISHVGLCVGDDEIIEANGFNKKVVKKNISEVLKDSTLSAFAGIRRLLKDKIKPI